MINSASKMDKSGNWYPDICWNFLARKFRAAIGNDGKVEEFLRLVPINAFIETGNPARLSFFYKEFFNQENGKWTRYFQRRLINTNGDWNQIRETIKLVPRNFCFELLVKVSCWHYATNQAELLTQLGKFDEFLGLLKLFPLDIGSRLVNRERFKYFIKVAELGPWKGTDLLGSLGAILESVPIRRRTDLVGVVEFFEMVRIGEFERTSKMLGEILDPCYYGELLESVSNISTNS